MSTKHLKAYCVQDDIDAAIVFAGDTLQACKRALLKLGANHERARLRCKRVPLLDVYANAGAVPLRVLAEDLGWAVNCTVCKQNIEGAGVWLNDNVVRCAECR